MNLFKVIKHEALKSKLVNERRTGLIKNNVLTKNLCLTCGFAIIMRVEDV